MEKIKRISDLMEKITPEKNKIVLIGRGNMGAPRMFNLNEYVNGKIEENIDVLKWVLTLIDDPGNNSGDVKQEIHKKIFTFEEKKDGSTEKK